MNPNELMPVEACVQPVEQAPTKRDDAVDHMTDEMRRKTQDKGYILQMDPIDLGGGDGIDTGGF